MSYAMAPGNPSTAPGIANGLRLDEWTRGAGSLRVALSAKLIAHAYPIVPILDRLNGLAWCCAGGFELG